MESTFEELKVKANDVTQSLSIEPCTTYLVLVVVECIVVLHLLPTQGIQVQIASHIVA